MSDFEVYEIPGFTTQGGITFDATVAYKTFGSLNAARDNAVLIPTFYGGRHEDTEYMVGSDRAIDPERYFVVIANMFGNGYSSSPSNIAPPYGAGAFPLITAFDNVRAQHQLVTEKLDVARLRLVAGFSMGALQSFQWGALHSGMIDAIAPICGAARISPHNHVFIQSAVNALKLDPEFLDGYYQSPPVRGLLAFGHVYAAWLFSQDFYRERLYEQLGLASRDDAVRFTQSYFLANDANNLIAMANTWLNADISANPVFNNDFGAALSAITCRAIVMPGDTDLYFRVADSEIEVAGMPNAELRTIPSKWGHGAGFGADPADNAFIDEALRELLGD